MPARILGYLAIVTGIACPTVSAQSSGNDVSWSVASENDLFGGTDRHYTNGVRIERFSPTDKVHPWLRESARLIPFIDLERTELRQGLGLTHVIYTPEDISRVVPDSKDRPYAGWLALSLTGVATQRLEGGRVAQDSLQLNLGIVGPSALGEQVQTSYHQLINGVEPLGWDSQLRDEPGIELVAQRLETIPGPTLFGEIETDLAAHGSLALGNVSTYAGVGGMVRLGFDLDSSFGPPRLRPALSGAGVYDPSRSLGGYIFVGAEGRLVARDIFLDGNTFRDSPRVDRKPFVSDLQAGIAVNIGSVQVAFSYVSRSEQFVGQTGPQRFGAISISLTR